MKILFAIDNLGRGGRERRILELIKGLLHDGSFEICLLVFSNWIEYEEVNHLPIQLVSMPRKTKKDVKVFRKVYRLCKSFRPDLIHAWGDMSTIYSIPSSLFLNIPIYNSNVADAPNKLGFFNKELIRKRITTPFSKKVIANSYAGLNAYKIPRSKGVCIHNGFDFKRLAHLKPAWELIHEFNLKGKKVIGMIGAFQVRKDYKTYIDAAKIILKSHEDVVFLAIGEGSMRKKMMNYVGRDYEEKIIFTGLRKDIESIIQVIDVGVLSTNTDVHGEGISNVILEFMAQGKAVVATKGGGTGEIVDDTETGFLINPQKPEELAQKIELLMLDSKLREHMGYLGKEKIYKHFEISKMIKSYKDLYEELRGENRLLKLA